VLAAGRYNESNNSPLAFALTSTNISSKKIPVFASRLAALDPNPGMDRHQNLSGWPSKKAFIVFSKVLYYE